MKKGKSLLSKMMYSVGFTIAIVCIVMVGILSYAENQLGSMQSVIWITVATGLVIMIGAIILTTAGISKRITELTETANRLAVGDADVELNTDMQNPSDQIGDLSVAMAAIADNMKTRATAVKKMADGDFTIEIDLTSEKDTVGSCLMKIRDSVKCVETDAAMLTDLAGQGVFNKRADAAGLSGNYQMIIENINNMFDNAQKRCIGMKRFWIRYLIHYM